MASVIESTGKSPTNAVILEALRAKVRQCREDAEKARDEATEAQRNYDAERKRREQVVCQKFRAFFSLNLYLNQAENDVAGLSRRINLLQDDTERAEERLKVVNLRLEETSKAADESERYENIKIFLQIQAEAEVASLNRRIQLVEEEFERASERLKTATDKLVEASKAADESER